VPGKAKVVTGTPLVSGVGLVAGPVSPPPLLLLLKLIPPIPPAPPPTPPGSRLFRGKGIIELEVDGGAGLVTSPRGGMGGIIGVVEPELEPGVVAEEGGWAGLVIPPRCGPEPEPEPEETGGGGASLRVERVGVRSSADAVEAEAAKNAAAHARAAARRKFAILPRRG
jgi:hypothetical protein